MPSEYGVRAWPASRTPMQPDTRMRWTVVRSGGCCSSRVTTSLTMDPQRRIVADGAVLVDGDRIVAVGPARRAGRPGARRRGRRRARSPRAAGADQRPPAPHRRPARALGDPRRHRRRGRHLPLGRSRSTPPTRATTTSCRRRWRSSRPSTNGITFTVEAGTVAHPDRVLAAYDTVGVGGTLGSWGWDVADGPFAGPVDDVLARQRHVLDAHGRPRPRPRLGHARRPRPHVRRARRRAPAPSPATSAPTSRSTSPRRDGDAASYLARTGRRPVRPPRRARRRSARTCSLAHAVHLDDDEVDDRPRPTTSPSPAARGRTSASARAWPAPGGTRSSSPAAAASPSGATARTPATTSTSCAPRRSRPASPSTAAAPRSAPTPPSSWPRSAAPTPIGMARTSSARWSPASGPTSSSSTRPGRTGCRAPRPRPPARLGERRRATSATSSRPGRVVVRDGECTTVDVAALGGRGRRPATAPADGRRARPGAALARRLTPAGPDRLSERTTSVSCGCGTSRWCPTCPC